MIKQFLIQVIPDQSTRMLMQDDRLIAELESWCQSYFKVWSTGPVPRVHVIGLNAEQALALLRCHIHAKLEKI